MIDLKQERLDRATVRLREAIVNAKATICEAFDMMAVAVDDLISAASLPGASVPAIEDLLDIEGAAKILGVSAETVRAYRSKHLIPYVAMPSGNEGREIVRFDPVALRAWITERTRGIA